MLSTKKILRFWKDKLIQILVKKYKTNKNKCPFNTTVGNTTIIKVKPGTSVWKKMSIEIWGIEAISITKKIIHSGLRRIYI